MFFPPVCFTGGTHPLTLKVEKAWSENRPPQSIDCGGRFSLTFRSGRETAIACVICNSKGRHPEKKVFPIARIT